MRTPAAGDLNQQVAVQSATVTRTTANAEVLTWSTTATIWARIVERGGREPQLADRPVMVVAYEVTTRDGVTITHANRLLWNSKTLSIETVTPLPRGYYTLRCLEVDI